MKTEFDHVFLYPIFEDLYDSGLIADLDNTISVNDFNSIQLQLISLRIINKLSIADADDLVINYSSGNRTADSLILSLLDDDEVKEALKQLKENKAMFSEEVDND